jgi:hypothetical protein
VTFDASRVNVVKWMAIFAPLSFSPMQAVQVAT